MARPLNVAFARATWEGRARTSCSAAADPAIRELVPSDIEFRGNYCFNPLSCKIGHPSYAGVPRAVKNRFVDGFDVQGFAEQMVKGQVGWVLFCIDDHYFGWPCAQQETS